MANMPKKTKLYSCFLLLLRIYPDSPVHTLMPSMAWVRRCYSEKSKNLNKLLVFEALYPLPGEDEDLGKLQLNFAEKNYNIQKHLILNFA